MVCVCCVLVWWWYVLVCVGVWLLFVVVVLVLLWCLSLVVCVVARLLLSGGLSSLRSWLCQCCRMQLKNKINRNLILIERFQGKRLVTGTGI